MASATLDQLAENAGIEPEYHDYFGRAVTVSQSTKEALVLALAAATDRTHPRLLPPVSVVRTDADAIRVGVRLAVDAVNWILVLEDETVLTGRARVADGTLTIAQQLPLGYHRLTVRDASAALIVVPPRAWLPATLASGTAIWGFALQLYSLRSQADWGIGDFGALRDFAASAASAGAQAIGLNPLHAPNVADPTACSPYDPASRLRVNPLYIDVETLDDYRASMRAQTAAQLLRPPRGGALVDYEAVATGKLGVLELCYDWFLTHHREDERARRFAAFVERGATALHDFALFSALAEHIRATTGIRGGWAAWPERYRPRHGEAVREFEREYTRRIRFHAYLQWIADEQLAHAAAACSGATIGLYRDLAVGTGADGADSWSAPEAFVSRVSIGAPPDAVNTAGQNWGLTPFRPAVLRETGYAPFVALLRANMRHAGALRIDHVMAMQRLFLIPHGRPASEGAYVRYPFDDMLGIIALESVRARCAVVGEDLGTVPEGFRERIAERGIFGCRLLLFEHDAAGFRPPGSYPVNALVSTGTHDLPSLPSWWQGVDIDVRERLGIPAVDGRDERARLRTLLAEALCASGELTDPDDLADLVRSAYRFLGRSPSLFLIVQLEDVLLRTEAINIPGTHDEHPNWRRRLPIEARDIVRATLVEQVTRDLRALRPMPRGTEGASVLPNDRAG
jgi:4-alpha-glucanotransferase